MQDRFRTRLLAGILALAAAAAGLWVGLLAVIASGSLQRPDPDPALDGNPCCSHPDTWADVVLGSLYFVAISSVATGLLLLAATLGVISIRGRPPRLVRRRLARAFGIYCIVCAAAVPLSWLVLN